ncbi:hypothetical protein FQR65_LT04578 [Abscondita terminalis]|nr:hypothetical protein FQR65_LT04578 [Abscondita terminalis]
MKTIALFACFLIIGTASAATKHQNLVHFNQRLEIAGDIEQWINNLIQSLSDPLDIAERSIEFLGWRAGFKDLHSDGIRSTVVDISVDLQLLLIKVKASVALKEVNLSVSSWESTFPVINGNGKAGISIKDASALVEFEINLFGENKPSNVDISIGSAEFILTGLLNDEVLSQSITDKVNNALNVVANDPAFHSKLEAIIDEFISLYRK